MILWKRLACGTCGRGFTANPATVPTFPVGGEIRAVCLRCWDLRAIIRTALGIPVEDRPPAYPEDIHLETTEDQLCQ